MIRTNFTDINRKRNKNMLVLNSFHLFLFFRVHHRYQIDLIMVYIRIKESNMFSTFFLAKINGNGLRHTLDDTREKTTVSLQYLSLINCSNVAKRTLSTLDRQ